MTKFEIILLSIVSFFCASSIGLLCYYLREFGNKISKLNDSLLVTMDRQEWHYKSIEDLKNRVYRIEERM